MTLLQAIKESTPEDLAEAILEMDRSKCGFAYDVASILADANPVKEFSGPDPLGGSPIRYHVIVKHFDSEDVGIRVGLKEMLWRMYRSQKKVRDVAREVAQGIPVTVFVGTDEDFIRALVESLVSLGADVEVMQECPPGPPMHTRTFQDRFRS